MRSPLATFLRQTSAHRSTVNPAVQIDQPTFQPGFILLPRHAVHSWRSSTLKRVEALADQGDAQMVEQSGEPLLLTFLFCLPHTVQSLGHALPPLCRVHDRPNHLLPPPCPPPPHLPRRSSLF